MRAIKKQTNKNIAEMNLFFFGMFFLSTEIKCFFRKSATIQCARLAEKNPHVFFGKARPSSDARAHLKQRKKP